MGDQLVKHEQLEYSSNEVFKMFIHRGYHKETLSDRYLPHWHQELEIVLLYHRSVHTIDGRRIEGEAGDLIITNSGSIHMIEPNPEPGHEHDLGAIVLLIPDQFLKKNLPEYQKIVFTNDTLHADAEVVSLMEKLSRHSTEATTTVYDHLLITGLILQLLYHLCLHRSAPRKNPSTDTGAKNIERLRGVLQYIEAHYTEKINEEDLAEQFYFSSAYFSRFFKKNMGITFHEYLISYRLLQARRELLNTKHTILEIACNNGFSDGRRLSLAFSKVYGMSPAEYRRTWHKQ